MFKFTAVRPLRNAALAAAAFAALGAAAPAVAGGYDEPGIVYADQYDGQFIGRHRPQVRQMPVIEDYDVIPARKIVRQLRRQGYGNIQEIALRGDTYRVMAVRNNGAMVKLRVDAYTGEILTIKRIGWVSAPVRPLPRHAIEPGVTIEFGWGNRY